MKVKFTFLWLVLLPALVLGATLNVPAPYATIQAAVNAAGSGDDIVVAAGTYVEQISVTKTLTFYGSNQGISAGATPGSRVAETIITGGFYIHLVSNSTVIDGFTIEQGYDNGSHKTGVVVGSATNVTVRNNIITDCGMVPAVVAQSDGIEVGYDSDNLTIENNEILDNWRGVYLNPSDGISITGNAIHANNGVGVGIGSSGQSNLSITGNNIHGHNVEGWGIDTVGSNVVAEDNTFNNSGTDIAHYGGSTIDASPNWWGDTNPSDDVVGDVTVYPCYTDASMTTLYGPVYNVTQDTYFVTIQPAIDAADPGDVIDVTAGVFYEILTVSTSVTITGAGTATYDGSGDWTGGTLVTRDPNVGGQATNQVVHVTAADVSLSDLTVDGRYGFDEGTGQTTNYGIMVDAVSGVILSDLHILDSTNHGIELNNADNATITDVLCMRTAFAPGYYNYFNYGLRCVDSENLDLDGFAAENVRRGIVVFQGYNSGALEDVTVLGNGEADGYGVGFYTSPEPGWWDPAWGDYEGDLTFTFEGSNLFTGMDYGIYISDELLSKDITLSVDPAATFDFWGVTANGGWRLGSGSVPNLDSVMSDMGLTDKTTGPPDLYDYPAPTEVWVDDNYYDGGPNDGHTWGYDAFDNIQDGIDAVSGSTVNVAAGTYTETLQFTNSYATDGLIISGDTVTPPTIIGGVNYQSSNDVYGLTLEYLILKGDAGANRIFNMAQTGDLYDLTLNHVEFDGESVSGRASFYGQNLTRDLTITNCEFHHITHWAAFDSNGGSGGDADRPLRDVTFQNNYMHDIKGSMAMRGLSTDWTDNVYVIDNTWEDIGETGVADVWAAFEINRATNAEIHGNTVDTVYEGSWGEGQAFQLWDIDTLDMHCNTIVNCHEGIWVPALATPTDVTNWVIYNNSIANCEEFHILVDAGVTGTPLDASGNWWGDLDPTDGLTGTIDYTPWLAVGTDTEPGTSGFQGDFSELWVDVDSPQTGTAAIIQEGIDMVDGSTINVTAGTYPGNLTLPANLNLLGAGATTTTIAGTGGTAVTITGDDVVIDGFTITNPTGHYAISSTDNSRITVSNNIVTDIGTSTTTGYVHAVVFVCSSVPVADITIEDNELHTIHADQYSSASAIAIGWTNGDEDITNLLIQRNDIYNIRSNTSPWNLGHGAYGILLSHAVSGAGLTINPQILDNTIDDLEGLWAHGIGLEGATPGAVVSGNCISNLVDHKTPSDAVAVMIEDNSGAGTLTVNYNSFTSLNVGMVSTNTGAIVDAENNWWGDVSGPYNPDTNPLATGCAVGPYIDYNPWTEGAYTVNQIASATHISVETWDASTPVHNPSQDSTIVTYSLSSVACAPDYFAYDVHIDYPAANLTPLSVNRIYTPGVPYVFTYTPLALANGHLEVSLALTGGGTEVDYNGDLFTVVFDGIVENLAALVEIDLVRVRERPNTPITPVATGADITIQVDDHVPTLVVTDPGTATCVNSEQTFTFDAEDNVDLYRIQYQFDTDGWNDAVAANIDGDEWDGNWTTTTLLSSLSDGDHTIYFRTWDDVGYLSSESSWAFHLDTGIPVAATNLDATPEHNTCNLTWTAGSGLDVYRLYYKLRTGYPYPTGLPTPSWSDTTTADGAMDVANTETSYVFTTGNTIGERGVYDFILVSEDCVNDPSAGSDVASATNYFLGDVTGSTGYDGIVYILDLNVLSTIYGTTPATNPGMEMNVGPTDDYSSYGLPAYGVTTALVDFEDLIIFAMNYGPTGPTILPITSFDEDGNKATPSTDVEMIVSLEDAEDGYQLALTGGLKGFSARLQTERQLESATAAGYTVMTYRDGDAWVIDVIALEGLIADGTNIALSITGEGSMDLASVDGRDGWNQPVLLTVENNLAENMPTVFNLAQNYPNPFNPVTTINYDLAASVPVELLVYNSLGQQVATLVHATQPAGRYSVNFDGSRLASGLYFYQLNAGEFNDLQKMLLVK